MTLGLDKDQPARKFMETPDAEWNPRISPSGGVVAYIVSKEQDLGAVLKVVAYPTPSIPVQVSASPVFGCLWLSADELGWIDTSRRMWSAMIASKNGQLDVGVPKPMFDGRPLDKQIRILDYDFGRDRVLIAIEHEPREDPRLILISDWRPDVLGEQSVRK